MESDHIQALIQAVHAGLGVALLPQKLVADSVARGLVIARDLAGEKLTRRNYVVWHANRYMSQALRDLIGICRTLGEAQNSEADMQTMESKEVPAPRG